MDPDLLARFKGLETQLLRVSAQLEFLTDYIMKDVSKTERDEFKKNVIADVEEKQRLMDFLDTQIIK